MSSPALSRRQSSLIRTRCRESLHRLSSNSSLFSDGEGNGPTKIIGLNDIEVGAILGSGGFNNILTILSSRRNSLFLDGSSQTNSNSIITTSTSMRDLVVNTSVPTSPPECSASTRSLVNTSVPSPAFSASMKRVSCSKFRRTSSLESTGSCDSFAVKTLRKSLDNTEMMHGAVDLAKEAKWLSVLSHRNIISLHCAGETPGSVNYFLVIERLEYTLSDAIGRWQRQNDSLFFCGLPRTQVKQSIQRSIGTRISILYEATAGIKYIHEKNILFRDLKPENIGIDPFGIVKIFDFGLAKELKLCDQVRPDLYRATRLIGTRRYMAPEVFYGPQYGLPSDVYSFSILLWQVIALKTPYCNMDIIEHVRFAFKKKRRPKLEKHWPKPISTLIKTGWSHKPKRRPKIGQIHEEIKEYLISTQDIEIDEC